jgi:hypothetical protein
MGVILLVPLQPLLTMPAVKTATAYMLPALFGSLFLGMFNENCGNFVAKGKLKCAVLPFILVLVVNHFYSLSGKEGFVVLAVMALSVTGSNSCRFTPRSLTGAPLTRNTPSPSIS